MENGAGRGRAARNDQKKAKMGDGGQAGVEHNWGGWVGCINGGGGCINGYNNMEMKGKEFGTIGREI